MKTMIVTLILLLACAGAIAQPYDSMRRSTNFVATDLIAVQTNSAGLPGQKFTTSMTMENFLRSLAGLDEWDDFSGGLSPGDKGDITIGPPWTIDAGVVTDAKLDQLGLIARAITNINEGNKIYVRTNGNNTTALRGSIVFPFRDPKAAVNAATVGDTVIVEAGNYNTNNLWKPGVNLHIMTGAHIGYTNTGPGLGIIDDRNGLGAGTNFFKINGTLAYESDSSADTQPDGNIVISNANTIAYIDIKRIEGQFYDVRTFGASPFVILNCRYVSIDADYITDNMNGINDSYGSIIYWENGRTHLNFKNADMDNGYAFWFKEPVGSPSSDIFVTGQRTTTATAAGNPVLIQFTGTNANWKAWVDVQEMSAPGGGGYGIAMDGTGGKLYVKNSKAGNVNTALQILGGEYWGTQQKISTGDGGFLTASGGSSFHLVQHWEDLHTTASIGPAFLISGGHHTFYPSVARVQNAKALSQSGGTSRWVNVTLDSVGTNKLVAATNNVPVWVTGGRVELVNCTLIAPTNAYAIDSPTPQTVYVYGTLTANQPISPNITIATILTNHISDLWVHGPWRSLGEGDHYGTESFYGNTYFQGTLTTFQGSSWTLPNVVIQDSISGPGGGITLDASGFNGNLATTDNTLQEVAQKLDDLTAAGGGGPGSVPANSTQLNTNAILTIIDGAKGTNLNNVGTFHVTNNPAGGPPKLRLWQTNGTAYTEWTLPAGWKPTNSIVFGLTNVAAGEYLRVQAVSVSGGVATILLTNAPLDATAWSAIGDAAGNGTIAFGNTIQDITSTLDQNGEAVLTISDTDTDIANDTTLLRLQHYDTGADANAIYLTLRSDGGGAPTEDYRFSQTAFNVASAVTTTLSGPVTASAGATLHGLVTVNSNLVFTPRPFVLGGTNWFAAGDRGMIFTNSHTALGLTNYFVTNILSGQEMTLEIFVGIGSTATLPQFLAADYTSGRIEGLTSNVVNVVKVRRTPMGTNVSVRTKEFTISGDGNVAFNTNLATMTITAGLASTVTNSSNIKFRLQQPGITVSNLFLSFDTNRYLLRGMTNAVFTNFVELADGESADMSVYVHNTTGVSMGLVWPAFGAQHGYYFSTNANNDVRAKTSLASGARGLASFSIFGTNIVPTWTDW